MVTTIPFNNVGKYLRRTDVQLPEELGGNCAELGERLIKELLSTEAADTADLMDIEDENFHVGVLATKAGQMFYLDPGLLQLKPVCISTLPVRGSVQVGALPLITAKPTVMTVKRLTANRLEVERKVEAKPFPFQFNRTFDTRVTRKEHPNPDPYGLKPELNHLLFRFPMPESEVRVRIDTSTGEIDCLRTDMNGETEKSLKTNQVAFDKVLSEVESRFNTPRGELFAYLEKAFTVYDQLHAQ